MPFHSGRQFVQIPGPTNVPERILAATARPTIDHRGPEAGAIVKECFAAMKAIFKTTGHVFIFPGSGTGAWEAALANTLNPGDHVVAFDNGQFASLWMKAATNFGLDVDCVPGDWRRGADTDALVARLDADKSHKIKAVMVVHNETSTGVTTDIAAIRKIMDAAKHPALLMVDTVSSLASIDYRHDEWGVDVAICGSQKGLMLPPGLGFTATSEKALAASKTAKLPRSFFRWEDHLAQNSNGFFPYTPAINLLYGLREAGKMLLEEEGLPNVFARHKRLAEATRRAVRAWGLEVYSTNPAEHSPSATAILMPEGFNEADLRGVIYNRFNMSLGAGLGKVMGKVFRIGHLGSLNELMIAGTLAGVEMGLGLAGVPHKKGGVAAAMDYLTAA